MTATWPRECSQAALQEGWDIFSTGAPKGHEPHDAYELSRVDFPDAWDDLDFTEPKFDGDPAAWRHVVERAKEDSELHKRALCFLKQEAPSEFAQVMSGVPS